MAHQPLCARYVREYWKIPKGRIENLTQILEDNGIIVFELDLEAMDGFCTFSQVQYLLFS
jgi:hypothetical protein